MMWDLTFNELKTLNDILESKVQEPLTNVEISLMKRVKKSLQEREIQLKKQLEEDQLNFDLNFKENYLRLGDY